MLLGPGEVTSLIPSLAIHSLEMTSSTCPQTMENPTLSSWTVTILRPLLSYMILISSSPPPTLQLSQNMSNREATTAPSITRSTLRLLRSSCSTYQTILVRNPTHTATTNVSGTMSIRYDERWLWVKKFDFLCKCLNNCIIQEVGCKVPWDTVTDSMEKCTTATQTGWN